MLDTETDARVSENIRRLAAFQPLESDSDSIDDDDLRSVNAFSSSDSEDEMDEMDIIKSIA